MSNSARILFYGTPEFGVPTLQELINNPAYKIVAVVTQPDRPSGRGKKLLPSPIKEIATRNSIPVFQPENIKKNLLSFQSELEKLAPLDLAIVIAFGQIIPLTILNFPRLGSINVHGSLLPKWRGAAPIQRSIEAGDAVSGICLMQMEAGLDSGPVYSSRLVDIEKNDTAGSLHDKLSLLSAQIIKDDLPKILNQEIKAITQDSAIATYAKKMNREEELIDWDQSAIQVHNKIRAFSPTPGAYTSYHQKILKILKSEVRETSPTLPPGSILYTDKTTLEIACKNGSILVKEVKAEGKRAMQIQDYLQGNSFTLGDLLS